jgi:hypothetical protein
MARMTQINIDASRLQGVDLSKVPNQKIAFKKTDRTQLNTLSANVAKASISTAANVSTVGQWASIPQDFGSGSLTASMVIPRSTPGSVAASKPVPLPPMTMGVTIGLTGLLLTPIAVLSVGGTIGGGVYLQLSPGEFGVLGAVGFAGALFTAGISVPVNILLVDGPISLLDGYGLMIVVDINVQAVYVGMGILVSLPSWKIIGFVVEFAGGAELGPPVTVSASLTYGGHIKLL